jgi:hypothetical protein
MSEEIKIILKEIIDKISKRKKGGFKTDGSTHHSGIKNEHYIVSWLNQEQSIIGKHLKPTNSNYLIKHQGGTQTKADAIVVNTIDNSIVKTLSIKNHKTGTFDWLNSTKGFPPEVSIFLKESMKKIKDNYSLHQSVEITRDEVDSLFSSILFKLKNNKDFICEIMNSIYQKYPDGILVNCEKEQTLIYFDKNELKELQGIPDSQYFLKHTPGTCSANIIRITKDSDEKINTNLRIRLVLNNGVNALVGSSLKNKTSVPCIKIQQDNVNSFLQSIENKLIEK